MSAATVEQITERHMLDLLRQRYTRIDTEVTDA